MGDITSFEGENRWLSNFYPAPVRVFGVTYPTVEHGYVACKTQNPQEREQILKCSSPGEVKRIGRRLTLRPGWDEHRLRIMELLLRQKFFPGSVLEARLLDTGDCQLVEGNWWKDTFWGVYRGKGENHLGKLLMKIRKEKSLGIRL